MAKYTETQTRKIISSYGGVGSIIETPKGALMIEPFDKWPFFRAIKNGNIQVEDFVINDNRLLKRLQTQKGFPKLKEFLRIPPNHSHPNNNSIPASPLETISSVYFPEWFYCNNCERFKNIRDWWKEWKNVMQKNNHQANKSDFIPPKCPYCYAKAIKKSKKTGKRQRIYYDLEQVRFIMTAPSGDMRDIPWKRWNKVNKEKKEDNETNSNNSIIFDWDNLCCENPQKQDLRYLKSKKYSDLAGIRIECDNCKSKNTLSGFFGMRIRVPNKNDVFYKPVLRTSNSCYYPILVSSIFLPTKREISLEDQNAIKEWLDDEEDINFIYKALRKKYAKEKIQNFIDGDIKGEFEPEIEYRLKEFNFLTEESRKKYPNTEKDEEESEHNLVFSRVKLNKLLKFNISNLTAIKRLKITTVQTAYSRQEPIDSDQFLNDEELEKSIEAKYTSKWANQTKYLPAIENFGEGIFVALDEQKISDWLQSANKNQKFKNRINQLFQNSRNSDLASVVTKFKDVTHLARFVLVHSLTHILIKELEFLCGYPATSLNERLFVDENKMAGFLIYTVAGSEGSYGGLVSQANEKDFQRILSAALYRATDCASDPICYNTEDGQGVGGLNMAACYSCSLLPENSCEEFNCFLDRSILIDKDYGFFN